MTYWTPKKLAEFLDVDDAGHVRLALRQKYLGREKYARWQLVRGDISTVDE